MLVSRKLSPSSTCIRMILPQTIKAWAWIRHDSATDTTIRHEVSLLAPRLKEHPPCTTFKLLISNAKDEVYVTLMAIQDLRRKKSTTSHLYIIIDYFVSLYISMKVAQVLPLLERFRPHRGQLFYGTSHRLVRRWWIPRTKPESLISWISP